MCASTKAGAQAGGGRKDFLGYYALLGLEGDLGSSIPEADIKKAFREAALRWHPDVLHVRFHEAQSARFKCLTSVHSPKAKLHFLLIYCCEEPSNS